MRLLVLSFLVACGSSSSVPDAESVLSCEAEVDQAIVKTCSVAADCVLLAHEDCCGVTEIGIAVTSRGAAEVAESHFDACLAAACGARGCASQTRAEDGSVPSGSQTIVPVCVSGACSSTVQ